MNKKLLLAILVAFIGFNLSNASFGKDISKKQINKGAILKQINLIQNPQNTELTVVLDKYLKYSNEHNLEGLKNLYSANFISGDGLKKDQVLDMIKDTWNNCPDIKYTSEIKNININDNYASVESYDTAIAKSVKKSDLISDLGNIESSSINITYFQKFGKVWKIVSDRVDYEKTFIKYGSAKNLNFKFFAPEQVYAGDNYTATLQADLNDNQFAFASISKEPIVFPETEPKEIFRQVDPDFKILERVLKSNTTNNNELVSASVGITEIATNGYSSPKIKLTGLAVLFQRVNVIPKSTYVALPKEQIDDNLADQDKFLDEEQEQ